MRVEAAGGFEEIGQTAGVEEFLVEAKLVSGSVTDGAGSLGVGDQARFRVAALGCFFFRPG